MTTTINLKRRENMSMKTNSWRKLAATLLGGVALTACAGVADSPVSPLAGGPNLAVWPGTITIKTAANTRFFEEKIVFCKVFANSLINPSAQFSAVITDLGTNTTYDPVNFALPDGYCADFGFHGDYGQDITVTETAIPNYTTTYTTQLATYSGGTRTFGSVSTPVIGYTAVGEEFGSRGDGRPATGTKIVFTNTYNPPVGCTFTQGYWKTHSLAGPAPYDDGWQSLPGGLEHNTIFYTSGKTWLELWNTSPKGRAYIQLAHQYMAAKLNVLNGASAPANVLTAITAAEAYFAAGGVGGITGLATLLDNYNNGIEGPGHCGA